MPTIRAIAHRYTITEATRRGAAEEHDIRLAGIVHTAAETTRLPWDAVQGHALVAATVPGPSGPSLRADPQLAVEEKLVESSSVGNQLIDIGGSGCRYSQRSVEQQLVAEKVP